MKKSRVTRRLQAKLKRAMSITNNFVIDQRDVIADLCEHLSKKGSYDVVLYSSGNVEITFGRTSEIDHENIVYFDQLELVY